MLTCKEASHLISDSQQQPLHWRQRTSLRIHLWMCGNCRRFAVQMRLLHQAMRGFSQRVLEDNDGPVLSGEAKQRIHAALQQREDTGQQ